MSHKASRAAQSGQALTEFIVVAFALIPLFLLIPVIAKYQDIAQSTMLASRYAAFEAAVRNDGVNAWKPEAELADEVRRRFFSNSDAAIKTGDVAGDFSANQNLFWRTPDDRPLIEKFSDVVVSYGEKLSADHANAFSATSDGSSMTMRTQLGLQARGMYTVNVAVSLANLPAGLKNYEPFDKINLSMTRSTSLVIDPWAASGPGTEDAHQVESRLMRSASVFPAASLQGPLSIVGSAVTIVDFPAALEPPKLGQLDFWRDVVPDDRLK